MLGLTRKQFIKRSKKCLDSEGIQVLNISELIDLELTGKISSTESYQRIRAVMKDLDSIFNSYEKLDPPSECVKTKHKILYSIIILHDAATAIYDSIQMELTHKNLDYDETKLNESKVLLNNFRQVFEPLTREIDEYLKV